MKRASRYIMESVALEVLLRVGLAAFFCFLEKVSPFMRQVTVAELEQHYNYPPRASVVPPGFMWGFVFVAPLLCVAAAYLISADKDDIYPSLMGLTLALGLNGVFTDTIKLLTGRPRPDSFARCFPDGLVPENHMCTGNINTIMEGRKSFPSGHSSFSFSAMGFLALWARGRLRRGGVSLAACLLPLYAALVVSLSRICDYHHFLEDVIAGGALGLAAAYAAYRQYYPAEGAGGPLDCSCDEDEPLLAMSARRDTKWS